jgi:hypothetical protein
VGAWFVALAASRRNGSPDLDVRAETDSRFVGDLIAVGLLCPTGFCSKAWGEWDAMSPQQAAAGRARAASAQRSPEGTFLPAESSGTSALDNANQRVQPSPPLPSPLSPGERGAGERGADDPVDAYFAVAGKTPTKNILDWLGELAADHGDAALCMALRSTEHDPAKTYLSRVANALTTIPRPNGKAVSEEEFMTKQAVKKARDPLIDEIMSAYEATKP